MEWREKIFPLLFYIIVLFDIALLGSVLTWIVWILHFLEWYGKNSYFSLIAMYFSPDFFSNPFWSNILHNYDIEWRDKHNVRAILGLFEISHCHHISGELELFLIETKYCRPRGPYWLAAAITSCGHQKLDSTGTRAGGLARLGVTAGPSLALLAEQKVAGCYWAQLGQYRMWER